MGSRLDKFVRNRRSVKADRAMEQGIAGHQAAMNALNTHNQIQKTHSKNEGPGKPMPGRVDYGSPQRAMGPAKGSTKGLTNG